MRRIAVMLVVPLVAAAVARGDDSLFQQVDYREVVRDLEQNGSRFYLAGIVGSSFATLTSPGTPSSNEPLFTSGGAAGVAFAWLDRAWRLEVEGRARDPLMQTTTVDEFGSTSALTATGGWSTTLNLWRDYHVTDWLTWYIGGGIGGGGYRFGVNQYYAKQDTTVTGVGTVGGFAWQAGGGLAWALTDRITLDLGYRYFELDGGGVNADASMTGTFIDTTRFSSAFSASELFFAIRIYEPFRGWRRVDRRHR
jgi:opacity protein-like surface antigen